MDVEFEDVTFKVYSNWWNIKDPGRTILKSVSGRFKAGELSAILGPSGAGKSSLLNAISGYRSAGISGQLRVNGQPRDESKFRKLSCYITQEDLLQPLLTLNEVMMFAAQLKLAGSTRKQKHIVVGEIQSLLGLTECRKTGTEALSGGQKKRLSIALELINNPPVLFLDEPTSGLDNVSTAYTLRLLRTLAHQGRTIVCTIHQPSASLFQLFDQVYFLSAGLCVYQGATQELVPFLSSVGLPCPTHYNPADFVIEMTDGDDNQNISVLSAATGNGKLTMKLSTTSLVEVQPTTNENGLQGEASNNNNRQLAASLMNYQCTSKAVKNKEWCPDLYTSYWSQFITLFCRMFLQIRRNRLALKIQFYHHVGCGLAIGIVFYDMARDGDQFFNHMKFCMGVILFHVYTQCMVPVLTFPYEVKLMKKELFNRWYSLRSYYMALTFSKVPTLVTFSLMFLTIVYALSGLPLELHRFIVFCFVGVMTAFVSEGLGQAIGSVFSVTNGSAVGPMTIAPFLGFAIYGFDFAKSIPIWLVPLLKTSFLRSGVIALVITVFGMGRGRLDCYHPMYCHFKDPRVIIHYLDLDNVSPWVEIGSMFAMLLIFKVLCYLGLMWRVRT